MTRPIYDNTNVYNIRLLNRKIIIRVTFSYFDVLWKGVFNKCQTVQIMLPLQTIVYVPQNCDQNAIK